MRSPSLFIASLLLSVAPTTFVSGSTIPSRATAKTGVHRDRAAASGTFNLFVSHYSGKVYSLALDYRGSNGTSSLSVTTELETCGGLPSWLTFEPGSRTLYCSDESFEATDGNSANGSLTALSAGADGTLTELAKATTLPGGVANVIYPAAGGKSFIAIAHYQSSSVSTFALPLTSDSKALQTFQYTLAEPGPNPSRQDAPHPHQVFIDPQAGYVLSPDLGADVVRIYAINEGGVLDECPSLNVTAGDGPRHGVFYNIPGGEYRELYIANELANTVTSYTMQWGECMSFGPPTVVTPYPTPVPSTANVAEVHLWGQNLFVSVRNDLAFPPNDSMARLAITGLADLSFQELSSSYGRTPRTFAINYEANLVAIGDQATSNVAIVKIDPSTGKLGDLVANLQVGPTGTPGSSDGLSSVVWDQ